MTTFKCIRSGNVVSFDNEDDIAQLRKHEGYIEIKDNQHEEEIRQETPKEVLIEGTITLKKRGRPIKVR